MLRLLLRPNLCPPTANTTIKSGSPGTNNGSASTLDADDSPAVFGFGDWNKESRRCEAEPLQQKLLNQRRGTSIELPSTWSENGVTWNTAPMADTAAFASLGAVASGHWYEVDITPLITGDGTYSLRIQSTSSNGAGYFSREGTGFARSGGNGRELKVYGHD